MSDMTASMPGSEVHDGWDWNLPGDLKKCGNCGKWTCYEHLDRFSWCVRCSEKQQADEEAKKPDWHVKLMCT